MSTVKANNYQDASGGSNAQLFGVASPPNSMGFRNRIINGAMVIDQRNAGASVTAPADGYALDRWKTYASGGGVMTVQRSTTAPAGFTNSQFFTVTTADSSLAGTDAYGVQQMPEGFNVADLGWGTASAQTITVSFWVRSSVTGTYTLSIRNNADNRSYLATYTISAANTFEYKTITIPGDTSGTWLTDNGVGMRVWFDLGAGSTYTGAAGSWTGSVLTHATGGTNWIATNGATLYITGVQLEAGTNASAFERRPYGTELGLCQRYYEKSDNINTSLFWCGNTNSSGTYYFPVKYVVTKRATATVAFSSITNSGFPNTITAGAESTVGFRADSTSNSTGSANFFRADWTASAEL